MNKKSRLVRGIGINNFEGSIKIDGKDIKSYTSWRNMLDRCCGEKYQAKHPTYIGCYVSIDWIYFSKFKSWFDANYCEEWHLDKDILLKGNKIYSPETCCFVPREINAILVLGNRARGEYPIGVSPYGKVGKVQSQLRINGKVEHLGLFTDKQEAFECYKQAKEAQIKVVANEWRGKIADNVYEALINWKILITD